MKYTQLVGQCTLRNFVRILSGPFLMFKLAYEIRSDKKWSKYIIVQCAQSCFAYQRVFSKWLMAPEPQTLDKERKHLDLLRPPYHEAWRSTRAALEQTWQRSATDTHSTKEPKTFRNRQILQNLKSYWPDFWFTYMMLKFRFPKVTKSYLIFHLDLISRFNLLHTK